MKTFTILTACLLFINFHLVSQLDDLDYEPKGPIFQRSNNFEQGLIVTGSYGWRKNHASLNGELGYRFPKGFEIAIGTGAHGNQLLLPINNSEETVMVTSTPVYLSGKYFFVNGWLMPYAKVAAGYGSYNNSVNENLNEINSSYMLEAGLGLTLKTSRKMNYFFEVNQYNLKTNGSQTSVVGGNDINYSIWFNRVTFRIGVTRYLFKF